MTVRDDILTAIQEATDEVLGEEAPRLAESTGLAESEIDSLDLVEIVMVLEDRYDLVVDGEMLNDVTDVRGIVDLLVELRAAEASG